MAETRVWIPTAAVDAVRAPTKRSFRDRTKIGRSLSSDGLNVPSRREIIKEDPSRKRSLSGDDLKGTLHKEFSATAHSNEKPYEWTEGWMTKDGSNLMVRVEVPPNNPVNSMSVKSISVTFSPDKLGDTVLIANDKPHYPDDLVTLDHFHEPTVVECLKHRYAKGVMYTATGPVLVALNPFKHLPHLYGEEVMELYWNKAEQALENPLPPHVYNVADRSFRNMMRGIEMAIGRKLAVKFDQSILVSGESGAGKTVTTKYLMKYLAALSQRAAKLSSKKSTARAYLQAKQHNAKQPQVLRKCDSTLNAAATLQGSSSSIEAQVLQSNPILESFGNARTIRNDNSSRFGKFIEMQFTRAGRLVGTKIETYLLEKVRLVTQSPGERNYHIFYELLSGELSPEELERLYISTKATPWDFRLLSNSVFDRRDGVSDKDTCRGLRKAMRTIGFTDTEQDDVFRVVAALLHASNLKFNDLRGGEEAALDKNNKHLTPACQLLGISPDALNESLCFITIKAEGRSIRKPQDVPNAHKGMDALLKATYGALFEYLVNRVNESIAFKASPESESNSLRRPVAAIGVLDIFGFESFATNSFEQLCINYCNESLQQQFNTFMLKNEQAEYANEGIDWDFIKFPENQDVLELIDHRTTGLMTMLDDMCRAPGATDKSYVQQVYKLAEGQSRFQPNNKHDNRFSILHYAGSVEYTTDGFVEKNRDDLPRETCDLLMSSAHPFIHKLAEIITLNNQESTKQGTSKILRQDASNARTTVGGQFLQQVKDLRSKIDTTSPHYVRCIKPNESLVPDYFDAAMVAHQLRCGGILQAVSVTRAGFTLHYTHTDFLKRYGVLTCTRNANERTPSNRFGYRNGKIKEECQRLVHSLVEHLEQSPAPSESIKGNITVNTNQEDILIQFGTSKVLLKHRAFETLERMLGKVQNENATVLNSIFRRFLCRTAFLSVLGSFRAQLLEEGQTFEEWFRDNRELYYQSRDKNSIRIPNIVKNRMELYQKNASSSFRNSPSSSLDESKRRAIRLRNAAWIVIDGLWERNPNYDRPADAIKVTAD